mmetsp:Transcript_63962/g.93650  ORF Transcript_63962/g.93650 Transcript_63962/m.93650 type:complete len:246 (+) Transcript_63962:547-1284(+)
MTGGDKERGIRQATSTDQHLTISGVLLRNCELRAVALMQSCWVGYHSGAWAALSWYDLQEACSAQSLSSDCGWQPSWDNDFQRATPILACRQHRFVLLSLWNGVASCSKRPRGHHIDLTPKILKPRGHRIYLNPKTLKLCAQQALGDDALGTVQTCLSYFLRDFEGSQHLLFVQCPMDIRAMGFFCMSQWRMTGGEKGRGIRQATRMVQEPDYALFEPPIKEGQEVSRFAISGLRKAFRSPCNWA